MVRVQLQGYVDDCPSIFRSYVPPTKGVIVKRDVLDSKVSTRIPKAPTLKLLDGRLAPSDRREVYNCVGIILQMSWTVDRHPRSTKPSEYWLQTLAIVYDRHLFVDGIRSFLPNDGVVEVQDQNPSGLQFLRFIRNARFLASIPVWAAPDIRRGQTRFIQAFVPGSDKMFICCVQPSQAS